MDQRKRDDLWLRPMLDYAREADAISIGRSRADFETDRLYPLAIV